MTIVKEHDLRRGSTLVWTCSLAEALDGIGGVSRMEFVRHDHRSATAS